MSYILDNDKNGTESYVKTRTRFEREVTAAVDRKTPWPELVAATIHAVLTVADADPSSAYRLTLPSTGRRSRDLAAFTSAVDDLGARLRHGAPGAFRSERPPRNLVLRIARQLCLQLEKRPPEPATALAPDLIVFALTPYVGIAEARRLADQPIATL